MPHEEDAFCAETEAIGISDKSFLSSRAIDPILHNTEPERYSDLIIRMDFSSPSQVSNALATAKSKLCGHLKDLIASYARDEKELEDKINELFIIMSRS